MFTPCTYMRTYARCARMSHHIMLQQQHLYKSGMFMMMSTARLIGINRASCLISSQPLSYSCIGINVAEVPSARQTVSNLGIAHLHAAWHLTWDAMQLLLSFVYDWSAPILSCHLQLASLFLQDLVGSMHENKTYCMQGVKSLMNHRNRQYPTC